LTVQSGTEFADVSSELESVAYNAPETISHKQLPTTGTKVSVLTFVGVSLLAMLGLGVQKKKEGK